MNDLNPSLIRQYCDGELDAADMQRVETALAHDPAARALVEIERRLRPSVERLLVAETPVAPAGLDGMIRATLDAGTAPTVESVSSSSTARESWWRTSASRANLFAVAATLVLIAGTVLIGIFGPSIDTLRGTRPDVVASSASFAADEHIRCAECQETTRKRATYCSEPEATAYLSMYLQADVCVVDLTDMGYRFVGAGRVRFPHAERAVQVIYERESDSERAPRLSVFIVPVRSGYDIERLPQQGEWAVENFRSYPAGQNCRAEVQIARDDELVYFVVACDSGDYGKIVERLEAELVGQN